MDLSIFKRQTNRLSLVGQDSSSVRLSFNLLSEWTKVARLLDEHHLYHVQVIVSYKNFDNGNEERVFQYVESYGSYPDLHIISSINSGVDNKFETYSCIRKHGGLGTIILSQLF